MPRPPQPDEARPAPISTRWGRYIETLMASLGWNNVTLSRRSGVDRSLIGRWRNDGTEPSIESVRAVARAFNVDIREALVEAEIFSEEEMRIRSISPDVRLLTDEDLMTEIRRRMATRINSAADVAETSESSGVEEVCESTDPRADPEYPDPDPVLLSAVDSEPKPKPRRRRLKQPE